MGFSPKGTLTMSSKYDAMAKQAELERLIERDAPWAKLLYAPPRQSSTPADYLPMETVAGSYGTQWYRLQVGDTHLGIRPRSAADNLANVYWPEGRAPEGEYAFLADGFVIGYLHPGGEPTRIEARALLKAQAERLIREAGGEPTEIVAIQRESKWLEPMFLVSGISAEEAWAIGRDLGQPVVVSFHGDRLAVDQTDGLRRAGGYRFQVLVLPEAPCPMSLGYETTHSPKREGGPWVSRSMEVAGIWQLHFADSHQLLACHPCEKRQEDKGSAILLERWFPASRYKYSHTREHNHPGDEGRLRRFERVTPPHNPESNRGK